MEDQDFAILCSAGLFFFGTSVAGFPLFYFQLYFFMKLPSFHNLCLTKITPHSLARSSGV
jgi:hypothetical protein